MPGLLLKSRPQVSPWNFEFYLSFFYFILSSTCLFILAVLQSQPNSYFTVCHTSFALSFIKFSFCSVHAAHYCKNSEASHGCRLRVRWTKQMSSHSLFCTGTVKLELSICFGISRRHMHFIYRLTSAAWSWNLLRRLVLQTRDVFGSGRAVMEWLCIEMQEESEKCICVCCFVEEECELMWRQNARQGLDSRLNGSRLVSSVQALMIIKERQR